MFFILSKIFWLIASPLHFCLLSLALGLTLARRWKLARPLALTATLLLALIVFSPAGALLLRPLEDRFPANPELAAAPATIIVLGGAIDENVSNLRNMPTLNDSGDRVVAGALLARRFPQAKLVFSGGTASFSGADGPSEAHIAEKLWRDMGVPPDQILIEDRSRNTFENASFTKALLAPQKDESWLLVTSAFHMPRAVGIFRRLGVKVTAFPVSFRTLGDRRDFRPPLDGPVAARNVEIALREYFGLIAYWLTGKTDTLFPAP